jgi:hypothetical protein
LLLHLLKFEKIIKAFTSTNTSDEHKILESF